MADAIDLLLAGEPVRLLADRALFWPRQRRLLIADLHLGKGDTFRAAGIPVPSGGTASDLARLQALLASTAATSLWVLGDFLHARRFAAVDAAWHAFRDAHATLDITVVRGNHDRALDPGRARVQVLDEGARESPFVFRHHPTEPAHPRDHVLCGHLHPVLRLPGEGRHPMFWLQPQVTVLPAFSRFTGGHAVPPGQARGSVVCDGTSVLVL
jgi:uncharacterized protein